MTRMIDDLQLDAELRRYLRLRADDTARVRDAEVMSRAIALRLPLRGRERDRGTRLVALLVSAALLAILGISALLVGGQRRAGEIAPPATGLPNGWIAYATQRSRGSSASGEIFLVREGVAPRLVSGASVSFLDRADCPGFSPDGSMLAYGEGRGVDGDWAQRSAVVVRVIDGRATDIVATVPETGSGPVPCPEWSADSRAIAYGRDDGSVAIHTIGGASTTIPSWGPSGTINDVAWSPGGTMLAVARSSGLWLVAQDGSPARTLGEGNATSVAWSPDGTRVAVEWERPDSYPGWGSPLQSFLRIAHVDGAGEQVELGRGSHPMFSPDGDRVAFLRHEPDSPDGPHLVVVAPDGSEARIVATEVRGAVWSPDSQWLLHVGGGELAELAVSSADGRSPRITLVRDLDLAWSSQLAWQPFDPTPSP